MKKHTDGKCDVLWTWWMIKPEFYIFLKSTRLYHTACMLLYTYIFITQSYPHNWRQIPSFKDLFCYVLFGWRSRAVLNTTFILAKAFCICFLFLQILKSATEQCATEQEKECCKTTDVFLYFKIKKESGVYCTTYIIISPWGVCMGACRCNHTECKRRGLAAK